MMYGYNGSGWVAVAIMMVLFWAVFVTGLVILIRRLPKTAPQLASHHNAERLLSDRFARGEIAEDEFEARRSALRRL